MFQLEDTVKCYFLVAESQAGSFSKYKLGNINFGSLWKQYFEDSGIILKKRENFLLLFRNEWEDFRSKIYI